MTDRCPTIITARDDWRHAWKQALEGWPTVLYRQAFSDPAMMLIGELQRVSEGIRLRDDRVYTIRANFGRALGPSLFGCRYSQQGDELPHIITRPDRAAVRFMLNRGVPDLENGLAARVWRFEQQWQEWLAPYPRLKSTVHVAVPELSGPFSFAHQMLGDAIFTMVEDEPLWVHDVLDLVTDTLIAVIKKHKELTGEARAVSYGQSYRLPGGGAVSDDAVTRLSEASYQRFAAPYYGRLEAALGGVMVRLSDASEQMFQMLVTTEGVKAVSLGNPDPHRFAAYYRTAAARNVALLWDGDILPEDDHIVTGVIHKRIVPSLEDALAVVKFLYGRVR